MVQMLCHLLECLLTTEDIPADCPKETYELYFVFAAIWAFGGAMAQDQVRGDAGLDAHVQARRGQNQRSSKDEENRTAECQNQSEGIGLFCYLSVALPETSVPTEGPFGARLMRSG